MQAMDIRVKTGLRDSRPRDIPDEHKVSVLVFVRQHIVGTMEEVALIRWQRRVSGRLLACDTTLQKTVSKNVHSSKIHDAGPEGTTPN